ncbi:MAG: DUF3307 domain-containing protein [Oceanipulchritudo sp.]
METLLTLLAAHVLGDFVFQSDTMSQHKRKPAVLLLHVLIVTGLSLLILGHLHWQILLAIFGLHLLLDAGKAYFLEDSCRSFLLDQGLHLIVLITLAALYPMAFHNGWWPVFLKEDQLPVFLAGLSLLTGIVLVVPAGGILVGKATQPLMTEIGEGAFPGLVRGGRLIGYLERSLVFLLVLINQPTGIGFLIATKSILRFGEVKDAAHRKVAEYIIIGTFLSFGWALLVAVLAQAAFQWFTGGITPATGP